MKLDPRIIEGKRPLTCFDAENTELIKTFLNKEGYFSNYLENFRFLNKCPKRLISNVFKENKPSFSIGETILYRYKGTYCGDHSEAELAYLGFIKPLDSITDEAGKGQIVLGNNAHGLQNLFDDYEMWVDGNWEPFGVEE